MLAQVVLEQEALVLALAHVPERAIVDRVLEQETLVVAQAQEKELPLAQVLDLEAQVLAMVLH